MKDNDIYNRILELKKQINHFAKHEVQLIAVSKTKPVSDIDETLKAGHRLFGENKIQEAMEKWPQLKKEYANIQLHLIGPLQSNKVRKAIGLFDVIQTLDRESLAKNIARISNEEKKNPQLYLQVNVGKEPQKSGVLPQDLDAFFEYTTLDLNLNIVGLMAIPPRDDSVGSYFTWLKKKQLSLGLPYLSMGMSRDYKQAITAGATHIRLGTAIFGGRA